MVGGWWVWRSVEVVGGVWCGGQGGRVAGWRGEILTFPARAWPMPFAVREHSTPSPSLFRSVSSLCSNTTMSRPRSVKSLACWPPKGPTHHRQSARGILFIFARVEMGRRPQAIALSKSKIPRVVVEKSVTAKKCLLFIDITTCRYTYSDFHSSNSKRKGLRERFCGASLHHFSL